MGPEYDFSSARFDGTTQVGDHNAKVNNHTGAQAGSLTITTQDLAALIAVLKGCEDDDAIPLTAEVLELKKAAVENSGELPAANIEEVAHTGLWSRVRESIAGSAVSDVLKGLLGIG